MDPAGVPQVIVNLPEVSLWGSPVLSGLITASATLLGVFLTILGQKWRSGADLREKRALARDQAIREWRSAQMKSLLEAANRRPGLYGQIATQAALGDGSGAKAALQALHSKDETIADSRYRAVDDAALLQAATEFQVADALVLEAFLRWLDAGEWKVLTHEKAETIRESLRPLEDAIQRLNRAAEAFIHRI